MAEKEAEKTEIEKPEIEKVEKKKKAKKKRKRVSSYYKIDENELKRMLPLCERCGPGYFMADHGDRYTCGHCGFTRYKREETG